MGYFIAFILALLIAAAFASGGDRTVSALLIFFFILFLSGIASMYWIVPFGPVVWGVSWLPMLFFVLIVALLFSAPPPRRKKIRPSEAAQEIAAAESFAEVSIFVWLLFCLLLIAIGVGYFR